MKKIVSIMSITILLAITLLSCENGSPDFISTIKNWKPYDEHGITATCEEVFDKYISSCTWTQEQPEKDIKTYYHVDVRGELESVPVLLRFSVKERNIEYEWEFFLIEIGDESYRDEEATSMFADFFDAYERGFATLSEYYESLEN